MGCGYSKSIVVSTNQQRQELLVRLFGLVQAKTKLANAQAVRDLDDLGDLGSEKVIDIDAFLAELEASLDQPEDQVSVSFYDANDVDDENSATQLLAFLDKADIEVIQAALDAAQLAPCQAVSTAALAAARTCAAGQ